MGYSMYQNKAEFKIKGRHVEKAFLALKSIKKSICYVDLYDLNKTTDLTNALKKFGWQLKFDQPTIQPLDVEATLSNLLAFSKANSLSKEKLEGDLTALILNLQQKNPNVIGISFMGEGYSNDIEMFNILAPFVEEGSFIEMSGEDGSIWRWVFDGQTCQEKQPEVKW
jgi:hypothetical protein